MSIGSGLLALLLISAQAPAVRANGGDDSLSFQLKVITVDGLGWRSTAYPRLKPVARQGTTTVWTADKALAQTLAAAAMPGESATAKSNLQGESTEGNALLVRYVAHMDRVADGPINEATAVAFVPEVATVDEGVKAKIEGRKLDQGVLTRISLEDNHVEAMHTVTMSETVKPVAKGVPYANYTRQRPGSSPVDINAPTPINFVMQVPEVSKSKVDGEWLIPNDGVLLMSLGVHTFADAQGMAVVRERLVILEVQPKTALTVKTIAPEYANIPEAIVDARFEPTPIGISQDYERRSRYVGPARAVDVQTAQVAMPPLPSRSTPKAIDATGKLVDLPPLPEGLASTELDQFQPASNQPSPQMRIPGGATTDAQLARTALEDDSPTNLPVFEDETPTGGIRFLKKLIESGILDDCEVDFEADASAMYFRVVPKGAGKTKDDDHCDQAETTPTSAMPKADCPAEAHCDNGVETATFKAQGFVKLAEGWAQVSKLVREPVEGAVEVKTRPVGLLGCLVEDVMKKLGCEIEVEKIYALNPTPKSAQVGIEVKNTDGHLVLSSGLNLETAIKNPGKTETITLPFSGKLAIEIKATVVPIKPVKP